MLYSNPENALAHGGKGLALPDNWLLPGNFGPHRQRCFPKLLRADSPSSARTGGYSAAATLLVSIYFFAICAKNAAAFLAISSGVRSFLRVPIIHA